MGSSSGKETTVQVPSSSAGNVINPAFQPFANAIGNIATGAVSGQPVAGQSVNPFYNPANYQVPNPQQVAGLTPLEQAAGGTVAGQVSGMPTPIQQQQAGQTYQNFTGSSNFGASPAVQAALRNYNATILPQVQNRYTLQGTGNSGMENFAEGQAAANAMIPLYQQDLSNQLAAAQGLNTLGQEQVANNQLALQNVMNYGNVQRQIQNAQNQAAYQDFLRLQQGAQGYVNPFGSILSANIPAGTTTTTSTGSGGAWGK